MDEGYCGWCAHVPCTCDALQPGELLEVVPEAPPPEAPPLPQASETGEAAFLTRRLQKLRCRLRRYAQQLDSPRPPVNMVRDELLALVEFVDDALVRAACSADRRPASDGAAPGYLPSNWCIMCQQAPCTCNDQQGGHP